MSELAPAQKNCPECSQVCAKEAQYCPSCGFPVGAINLNDQDPLIGAVLPGSYQIIDLLGVGGMGRVYRAEQRTLGRTVAIKVIHPHLASEEKSLARFLTEARATSKLNHPNSVSVIDFGKTDAGQPYLVMEFLRGQNLAQVAAAEGLLPEKRIVNVLQQVLAALGEAHELDIIHRDLKPENIVLEPMRRGGDFVKVVDFGLAKLKAGGPSTDITLPGIVCGTPDFMAPEQGRGDPLDGRSDLYAVGVVLFWLLTGRLPFEASSPTQVVMMHITMPVPDLRELAPQRKISEDLLQIVHKALAKDPNERFADAHEFANALLDTQLEGRNTIVPSWRAGARDSSRPTIPSEFVTCAACHSRVPHAKYCYDCGARLPSDTERPPSHRDARQLPLVGRGEELRWMGELLQNARNGLQTARLIGDTGSGKTRLLDEFLHNAVAKGSTVIRVEPDPYGAEVPGYVLTTLVKALLPQDLLTSSPPEHRLVEIVLRELLHDEPADELSPEERHPSYAHALRWSLEHAVLGQTEPLIVALDDLDRMDAMSRQAIKEALLQWSSHGPLMFLATHTARFNERWEGAQLRVLSGLPAHTATELLRRTNRGSGPIAVAEVGNAGIPPLYIDQVLSFGLGGGTQPPSRLGDLIAARLATLNAEQRRLIQALAVLGERVSESTLAQFLYEDKSQPIAEQVTTSLVEMRLIRAEPDGGFSLLHPLFREIVLTTTPAEARKDLHRKAGRLFRRQSAPLEVIAEHAVCSQDTMGALALLEQAAARASKRGDDLTATHLLRRGLDLAREEIYRGELDDPMRAIVFFGRKLGDALKRRGKYADAKGVVLEVLDNTPASGHQRVEVLAQLSEIAQRRGHVQEASRWIQQAIEVAARGGTPHELMEGLQLRLASLESMSSSRTAVQ